MADMEKHRNAAGCEGGEIVAPEFVFHEDGADGGDDADKPAGIGGGVEGEIAHHVGSGEILAHFVAGG